MPKYDVQLNSKVKRQTAKLMKETGYPPRVSHEYFVRDFYSNKPWIKLKVENFFLELDLEEINEKLDKLEFNKLKIIDKIRSNNSELEKYSDKVEDTKTKHSKYTEGCLLAIESIKQMYEKRKFLSEDSVFDVIDSSVFELKARNCDMDLDEFKEAVSELID